MDRTALALQIGNFYLTNFELSGTLKKALAENEKLKAACAAPAETPAVPTQEPAED